MDALSVCKENKKACSTGFILGILIALIIIYLCYKGAEHLTSKPDMSARGLLAYHNAADPISAAAMLKKEHLENKKENPALVALLYR